ncbi:MAG TPA: hypothetical protein VHY59_13075 [Chthoniobacterales bacterium]|nr:hypothetical protein [Chthoniobacterales bacterium]
MAKGGRMSFPSNIKMSEERMNEIARGAIDRYLADAVAEYKSEEVESATIYTEAYTLAWDALVDKGVDHAKAREVADRIARTYQKEDK